MRRGEEGERTKGGGKRKRREDRIEMRKGGRGGNSVERRRGWVVNGRIVFYIF